MGIFGKMFRRGAKVKEAPEPKELEKDWASEEAYRAAELRKQKQEKLLRNPNSLSSMGTNRSAPILKKTSQAYIDQSERDFADRQTRRKERIQKVSDQWHEHNNYGIQPVKRKSMFEKTPTQTFCSAFCCL